MRYQSFSVFGPWGLTPGPKFTKKGDDLLDSEIYYPAKFHRSTPTHARDIPYKNPADTHKQKTDKQTLTDISTTCLSACVDNKYASCPDWRISPHADRRSPITAKHKKFTTPAVTDHAAECFSQHTRWRRSGTFVTPG